MELPELYKLFLQNPEIVIDSRKAHPGSIFFGLRGENTNGGKFARQAIDSGCAAAIVDDRDLVVSHFCILVEDALQTLTELALYHRQHLDIPVLAITGSNGKTTTKELISSVLRTQKKVFATSGNLNNHIGVPLSILSISQEHEIAVIELGANHLKEIEQLCRIACPTHGLITMVGKAHLEGFGSPEGVLKAKSELYDYLNMNGGTVFINADDQILTKQLENFSGEIISYGKGKDEFCSGVLEQSYPYLSLSVSGLTCKLNENKMHTATTRLIGDYNFTNALAAACVGMYFGIELHSIIQGLTNYEPQNSRSQLKDTGRNKLILDYYNANPTSMELAIKNFKKIKGNKILILADMLELGNYSKEEHEKINSEAEECGASLVYEVGEYFRSTSSFPGKKHFLNTGELAAYLEKNKPEGFTILIKGSRGMKLEQILAYL